MPEDKNTTMVAENENASPSKGKTPTKTSGRNAHSQITMLDGAVLDVYIDVSVKMGLKVNLVAYVNTDICLSA